MNPKDRTILDQPWGKPEPKLVLPGNNKRKVEQENSLNAFIVDNMEILLANKLDKDCGIENGNIVMRFIKPRASIIIYHLPYFLDVPGP